MSEAVSSSLAALRALFEGAPVTLALLARAARRSEASLRKLSARQGWTPPRQMGGADMDRRLMQLSDRLIGELEKAGSEGERSGVYDKARIDALSAMLRMVEKIGETARGPERAREEQTKSDEEMAAALERIDGHILGLARELAHELAKELVEGMGGNEPAASPGAGDR